MAQTVFHPEVDEAFRELRGAIRSVMGSVGADPRRPQAVHRRFDLDRGLGWKISRVVRAETPDEALQYLPGTEGFDIFLEGMRSGGADEQAIAQARDAMKAIIETVERHVGDRSTLQLVLDGAARSKEQLSLSRKLAFRGNSGIWGVQARARVHTIVMAPNADDPELVDTGTIAGWVGFRRIRLNAPFRVFRRHYVGGDMPQENVVPIDPSETPGGAMLIPEFCEDLPNLDTHLDGGFTNYEVGPTTPGASGAFTIFSGFIQRAHGPRSVSAPHTAAEFSAHIVAPSEQLVFDLIAHRSMSFASDASVELFSTAFNDGSEHNRFTRLPIGCQREDLGSPPVVAMAMFPGAPRLLERVMERGGWPIDEFFGIRFSVDFPPFPSVAFLSVPLEGSRKAD